MADTYFEDATHLTTLVGTEAIPATSDPGGSPADVYFTPDDLMTYINSGYPMVTGFQNSTPADNTSYYFGAWQSLGVSATAAIRKMYIVKTGTIVYADVLFRQSAGTAETSTLSIRYDNTTDTAISSAITNDATETHFTNSGLSVAVTVGHYIELKWATPAGGWATNPTAVYCEVRLRIAD